MTGAPTRSPGEGGWTHTQRRGYPRTGVPGRPIPAMRRSSAGRGPREGALRERPGRTALTLTVRPHASRTPRRTGIRLALRSWTGSAGTDEGGPQVLVDRCFRNPEGASDPDRLQFAGVHQAIHGHLRHAHDQGHFGNGEKSDVA